MIVPSDPDYQQTKRIKQGLEGLSGPFEQLASRIEVLYGSRPLNITNEWVSLANSYRLMVIFEHAAEEEPFRAAFFQNDQRREIKVLEEFKKILSEPGRSGSPSFETDNLFVRFTAFAPIALQECNMRIQRMDIEALKKEYATHGLWAIERCFELTVFFFQTNLQLQASEASGLRKELSSVYRAFMTATDEFRYLDLVDANIKFDSKENLDEKYEGSLFLYFR